MTWEPLEEYEGKGFKAELPMGLYAHVFEPGSHGAAYFDDKWAWRAGHKTLGVEHSQIGFEWTEDDAKREALKHLTEYLEPLRELLLRGSLKDDE